ncbi:hypothetical protein IVA80_35185 [Bradyrhizobium sp. 139]|uniref:hypothetical protein n=1 Tax=Bradyrhizobium sp. 139 TaxID=2782616 RepID=UPI001FF964B1|nr:hypothetical protein [Bradyrhizobium sp. 139]MCK1745871.1 hypothetical protein [Bradyrhizobium sp. 139]
MALELKKISPVELRSVGLNEKWLQEQIKADTTILGLGELDIIGKEHKQQPGGRIDFLMHHADTDLFYEVEIMLGTLDESHIVRTIEYWDVERQRRPQSDHRAVIVAENITSRFFNVLRLLNRSVPMIAIQLSAFKLDDNKIVLHAVTVLDVVEEIVEEDGPEEMEETDRAYWEKKRDPGSISVVDKIASALRALGVDLQIAYNKHHIALRSTGKNFCWFRPRKTPGYCHVDFKLTPDVRDQALAAMQARGMDASSRGASRVTFSITNKAIDDHLEMVVDELKKAEVLSL